MALQSSMLSVLLGVALVASMTAGAAAQEGFFNPLTYMPDSAPFVETFFRWTHAEQSSLVIGEDSTILAGFINTGDEPLNVSVIMGSLNSQYNFGMYIQNFTSRYLNTSVEAEGEYTFAMNVRPHPNLDPMDLTLALSIFYEDEDIQYATTFYNETVKLVEAPQDLDVQGILTVVGLVAVAALLVAFFVGNGKSRSSPAASSTERGTGGDDVSEWIPQGMRDSAKKRGTSGGGRRRRK